MVCILCAYFTLALGNTATLDSVFLFIMFVWPLVSTYISRGDMIQEMVSGVLGSIIYILSLLNWGSCCLESRTCEMEQDPIA